MLKHRLHPNNFFNLNTFKPIKNFIFQLQTISNSFKKISKSLSSGNINHEPILRHTFQRYKNLINTNVSLLTQIYRNNFLPTWHANIIINAPIILPNCGHRAHHLLPMPSALATSLLLPHERPDSIEVCVAKSCDVTLSAENLGLPFSLKAFFYVFLGLIFVGGGGGIS